ncbi:hypothetical protein DESC_10029 [Desulfosarcina cetonica]|nr:hypothetical protein DESC_10029 [Desulfosarcina cetonica]
MNTSIPRLFHGQHGENEGGKAGAGQDEIVGQARRAAEGRGADRLRGVRQGQQDQQVLGPYRQMGQREKRPPQKGHGGDHEAGHHGLVGMGFDDHGQAHGQGCEDEAVKYEGQPQERRVNEDHTEQSTEDENHATGQKRPGHAGQDFAEHVGGVADGRGLEFLKDMPVKTGDVDLAADGKRLGHAGHGGQARDEKFDVAVARDGHMLAHGVTEGDHVEQRRYRPGADQLGDAPLEDQELTEVDGGPTFYHCTFFPVIFKKASSRFTRRMENPLWCSAA